MSDFGERLRVERTRLGMNQIEFGACGGVSKNAQYSYEKGERSPDTDYLEALLAHGVDVCFLLTGERGAAALHLTELKVAALSAFDAMDETAQRLALAVLRTMASFK